MTREEANDWISKTCGEGWLHLVDQVYDNLPEGVEIIQAYQKWAGLHFDTSKEFESFDRYLDEILEISEVTCEKCGENGSHYIIDSWEHTRCVTHGEGGIDLNNLPSNT